MMAATRAGAAGGTVARPPEPSPAASIARPARDPKACSSSRRTWASVGAPRPLAERAFGGLLETLPSRPRRARSRPARAAAARPGSGGGMYGGPVRHSAIWCISAEPQPAAIREAMQKAIATPRRTLAEYGGHKGVCALTHTGPAKG